MPFKRILWAATPIVLVAGGILFMNRRDATPGIQFHFSDLVHQPETHRVRREPPPPVAGAFVQLTGMGDHETASQGFSLRAPMDVRIHAVGEGSGNDMYDYGWIVDATTRRAIWRMEFENTEHAGGSSKNRVVDEVVTLDSGSYIVHYVTDGSHSWEDWNSSPPTHEDAWGITLVAPGDVVDETVVLAYDEATDPAVIAQLTQMGDRVKARRRFTLEKETKVHIYALGEGSGGTMYDYAWIEEASTGRAVWEMTYRMSEHAGGATKNRLFDGTVILPAGEYVLRYQSDGSHSAEEWNADVPDDPSAWGVTLRRMTTPMP